MNSTIGRARRAEAIRRASTIVAARNSHRSGHSPSFLKAGALPDRPPPVQRGAHLAAPGTGLARQTNSVSSGAPDAVAVRRLSAPMGSACARPCRHDGHLESQYVWTLFVKPFQAATGTGLATVQITFSLLIVLQTLFSPAQGWLVDRFGPKALGAVGAALTGLGCVLSARVDNVWMLFLTYGLFCGVGTGIRPRQDRVAVAFIRAPLSLHTSPRRRDPSAPRPGPG